MPSHERPYQEQLREALRLALTHRVLATAGCPDTFSCREALVDAAMAEASPLLTRWEQDHATIRRERDELRQALKVKPQSEKRTEAEVHADMLMVARRQLDVEREQARERDRVETAAQKVSEELRKAEADLAALREAQFETRDSIVMAANAARAGCVDRLRRAIASSRGKMPLTADECVTILENTDWSAVPEADPAVVMKGERQ